VLDACAAPGGKSAHILETADVTLTALDADAARAARIDAGLARLGLAASVRIADCTALDAWWDGQPFERILADVPCSGSGVARRHPDIKWLRRAQDLPAFARRQAAILDALWFALAPGGKLLYVTCSMFAEENGAGWTPSARTRRRGGQLAAARQHSCRRARTRRFFLCLAREGGLTQRAMRYSATLPKFLVALACCAALAARADDIACWTRGLPPPRKACCSARISLSISTRA
jgi:hypothetical protein